MAKAAEKDKDEGTNGAAALAGETTSAYFRRIFEETPKLLKSTSNAVILRRWLNDHPGYAEVPQNIKNNLANIKSVLRKGLRKRKGKRKAMAEGTLAESAPRTARKPAYASPHRKLEALEEEIDECLTFARNLDREGLENVIQILRRARNKVVWKLGE